MVFEPNPDFERLRKTVRHEEPDRVPLLECLVEYPIQSQFLGRQVTADDLESQVEFWYRAGYDIIPITVSVMAAGKVTEESAISKVIKSVMLADSPDAEKETSWSLEYASFINDRADFEKFPWEELKKIDLGNLYRVKDLLPEGMKVIAVSGKIFTLTWMLMGFNNFGLKLIMEEQLVADIFHQVSEIQLLLLEKIFELPYVKAVWLIDDLAFGTGPMISPQAFRDHVFPWYREIGKRCHENDVLLMQHSDGDLTMLMEDIIDIGIDLIHPIDPTCMDIVKVKEMYGDRICLAGNLSNELLRSGTPAEIDAQAKYLIENLAPGGGYCLAAGNSVPEWASFENYMAMLEAASKYGKYPIQV
jgi:uroporphyrinogen decarboxylase